MANVVVVGLQWGDEAKGKVVDYLSQDADVVVRYNGGNNAGHTVVLGNDEIYKFHIVPAGILNPSITSVIADGVVIDPAVLVEEFGRLQSHGVSLDRLKISGNAHVIMPYHKMLDRLEEESKGAKKIGTTGRGIGPAYADKISRVGIRVSELIDMDQFSTRLSDCLKRKNAILTKIYGAEPLDEAEVFAEYKGLGEAITPYVTDTALFLHKAARENKKIVFEGAHGTLLDIDHGTYPYVTSSHTVAGGACIGTGIGPTLISNVIGVAKAYTTRVGEGWFPTELLDETGDYIRERGREYGTTTGRPRRCGWFDAVAVRLSARLSAVRCIAFISLDVLSGLDKLRVCSAYRVNGGIIRDFPSDAAVLRECTPVYDELPGWKEDISGATSLDDLPANARDYLTHAAEVVGYPIAIASVGRRREQTLVIRPDLLES
ncbi:MAG: adenylosuccinate synthase [Armatimonadota bacterium]|nr:adenylosuccinate synthase [Armatimonadota bacterium]